MYWHVARSDPADRMPRHNRAATSYASTSRDGSTQTHLTPPSSLADYGDIYYVD